MTKKETIKWFTNVLAGNEIKKVKELLEFEPEMSIESEELAIMCAQIGTPEMMDLLREEGEMSVLVEGPMIEPLNVKGHITSVIGSAANSGNSEMLKYLIPLVGKE